MSYGRHTTVVHPCGTELTHVDYSVDPPPIPPPQSGKYSSYNNWLIEDQSFSECPSCGEELPDPAEFDNRDARIENLKKALGAVLGVIGTPDYSWADMPRDDPRRDPLNHNWVVLTKARTTLETS